MAIRRTTPALLGLFSLIALLADRQMRRAVGVVRQAAWYHKRDPDLRRRFGAGAQRVVGSRSDFLRVAFGDRHGKSPTGICGTPNRGGLLRGVMAKVEQDEVRRFYLLVTRAELFRRCRTRRNPAISVKRSIPEDRSTPPAMPSNHLQHTDARDEASGHYSTADVLLTKPPMFWSEAFRFYGFCR